MNDILRISFDKSQEDIPVLTVYTEVPMFYQSPAIYVIKCITGDEAIDIYKKLTGKDVK